MSDPVCVEEILACAEPSLLIIEQRGRKDIVVGVPHHAPAGVPRLRCAENRVSDENAGFIGRQLAEQLDCCSVIACNYTIDANKNLRTDYAVQIVAWKPRVLIEIHGSKKSESGHDVEISCGSRELTERSKALAEALSKRLERAGVGPLTVTGDFDKLSRTSKATKTPTITRSLWIAYHVELSPRLRKPESRKTGKPPKLGNAFCQHMAAVVKETYRQA